MEPPQQELTNDGAAAGAILNDATPERPRR
jgi:hypothetical protein